MPFGSGFTIRLRRPSFKQNLVDDMQSVAEGRLGMNNNSRLIQNFSSEFTGVDSITRNGSFVGMVGNTEVGGGDKVGLPTKIAIGD